MPGDLFIRSKRWRVAVVSTGLHILLSVRAGPSVHVVFNHAASIGVRQKIERERMQKQLETMFERMGASVRVRETLAETAEGSTFDPTGTVNTSTSELERRTGLNTK